MKKMFTLLCMQLLFFGAFAQNNCVDFENETPNPNLNIWNNPPSNWNTIDCRYDFRQEGNGNIYLEVKDGSGASFIYNNTDFTGDLSNANNCQTFCFDLNYLDAGANNATTFRNSIYIYSGGTTPLNSPLCARYVLNTPISAGSGWNTFCLPLDFCNGTTLPDNAEGYWEWIYSTSFSNTGSTCTDWSNLITNVTGISFYIDLGSNPSEEWGLDNFCIVDTTCYNDKQFSTCFYTDVEDPSANNFNEFGFAGCQKQDGTFFLFGETQNRGLFAPSNVTDDYFLRANLDDFGNVQPIADYIHPDNPADVRFDNHILVKMDPIFTTVNSSLLAFSNYQATGTINNDVQVTFFDAETDCIESTGNWPNTPNSSEFVKDAMQGSNSDLVVIGECYDHATPNDRRPFLYGFDITGADFGNQKLNVIAPDGNGLAEVSVNAITEYTAMGGGQRYAIVGEVNDRVLFFDVDLNLNGVGTYLWLDIDNDPVTQETAIDIVFDNQDNTFVIAGNIFQPSLSDPNGPITLPTNRIFVSKMNLQGQVQWTNIYNIPGGGESVRELHVNAKQEIVITGSCESPEGFVVVGGPRNDISYLLKTAKDGAFLWANKYANAEGNQVLDLEYCIDKGYLMTGSCWTNYPDPNGGPFQNMLQNHDVWAVKTDSLGMLGPDAEVCVTPTDVVIINPDYETGVNEIWGETIEFDGEDHEFECIPYVHGQEVCVQYCPPPPNEVCDITTTFTTTQTDSCCMASLNLTNNMLGAHQIRIDILNPVPGTPTTSYFDVTNINPPFCLLSQNDTQVILEMCGGGPIPTGTFSNYFEFCLGDTLGTATSDQIRVFHMNAFGVPFSGCFDDYTIDCPMEPDPCYEVIGEDVSCTEFTGVFDFCFIVKNNDILDSLAVVTFSAPSNVFFNPSNQVQFSPPIPPGATSAVVCVRMHDQTSLPLPRQITLGHDAHDRLYEYCCLGDSLDIVLPNCCEPCVPDWIVVSPDSLGADSCCFALDFNIECPLSLKQLRVESITPGVEINNVSLGGVGASNWNLTTTNTTAILDPNGFPTASVGFYDDLLNFCLNDTLGVPLQEVIVSYIGCTPLGGDTILCQDTLQFNCEIDTDCIEIIEDFVYCDDMGNYFVDFCIQNTSNPAFNANELVINYTSASGLVITPDRFYPINLPVNGIYCNTVQIVGLFPNVPSPGQQIQLGFALHQNLGIEYDTCCIDEELLLVELPDCEPMVGECCENIDVFQSLAAQTTIIYSGGVVTVDNPNLNDCHFVDILWGDGFGVDHNAAANLPFTHSYAAPGTYTVDVLISEESPNGELCFEFALSQTIQTQLVPIETHVRMYPNPFVDQLEVQLGVVLDSDQELEVRTANGTLVHHARLVEGQQNYKIDASRWGAGLYIIYIKNEEGIQSTQKLVKINP